MKKSSNLSLLSVTLSLMLAFLNVNHPGLAQEESGQIVIGKTVMLKSRILNEERDLLIYLPHGYKESKQRYPVLYLLDGTAHFHHASGIVQYLSTRGIIPPMIVVGLVNTVRSRDLCPVKLEKHPNTGGSDRFLKFIADELIPFIEGEYRTHPHRTLVGHSFGGTFALYTLVQNPDLFDFFIAISPAVFLYNKLLIEDADTILAGRSTLNKYLYITVGDEPDFRRGIQDFVKILGDKAPNDLRWKFEDLGKEDHMLTPHLSIYNGLETVFSDWRLPDNVLEKGVKEIKEFYERLSRKYGFEIHARMQTLNVLGFSLMEEKKYKDAIEVYNYCVSIYPDFWMAYHNLGYCYQQTGDRELAIKCYEKTLQLNPRNQVAMERLKKLKGKTETENNEFPILKGDYLGQPPPGGKAGVIQDIKKDEGIEQNTFFAEEIFDAARNGEVEKIRQLLDNDKNLLNSKDQSGKTPLHFASQYGHFDMVKILIERGAEVNVENNNGETPLHYASAYGQENVAEFLISNGAELEYRSWRHGDTPAHAAAIGGHVEMVSFLDQKGARLDVLNDFGETPLHYAADFGHIKVVEYLIAEGQEINSKNKDGWTPLHYAAFSGRTDAAELMISQGADVAARDNFGQTPLYRASWNGHRKTAELLVVKGSDIDTKDQGGDTPLHGAAYEGHGDVVKLLISRGAGVNIKNKRGRTPLDNAILRMHKDIQDDLRSKQGISSVNTHARSQKETALRIDETGEQNPIKITILYDNYVYTEGTKSHWGFSCLIEGTEKTILFDTGWKPEILKNNIEKTGADIKKVRQIVISHNHGDHTGGVFSILDENPDVTVFLPYSFPYDFVRRVEERNAEVITVSKPLEICSNVYLTGEMGDQIKEHSLILNTHKGLVIIAGCSHQGIVNIVKKAKEILKKEIYLVCGGFHLLHHSPEEVRDIIREFKELGVRYCGPTHCTGTHVIERFKEAFKDNYLQMGTGKVIRIE